MAPDLGKLPLAFEANAGQTDPSAHFIARAHGGVLYFTPSEVVMTLGGAQGDQTQQVVRLQFVGSNRVPSIESGQLLTGKVSYLVGSDRAKWLTARPTYAGIYYRGLYSGIDLEYTGAGGQLKGTYTVAAGADPGSIRWRYDGASAVSVDAAGNLQISLQQSALVEEAPVAWQTIGRQRVAVDVRYAVAADGSIGFALGSYDPAHPLTIDPTLTYSSYLGGTLSDEGHAIATDGNGNVYLTGIAGSLDFPLRGHFQTNQPGNDIFVTRINTNASGDPSLVYSTYLGGNGDDYGLGIAVDALGNAYVSGRTSSTNFPTLNQFQNYVGSLDAILTKLNPEGTALLYSTYYGGSSTDYAWGVAVDANQHAYITGQAVSANLGMRNAYQPTFGGVVDAFLARFNTTAAGDASLVYATYFGGSNDDYAGGRGLLDVGHGVAVDASGNAFLAGQTMSPNLPTRNAFDSTFGSGGNLDAWMARINTNASGDASLIYATYLGGTSSEAANDIATDGAGNAYITGESGNTFPTRGGVGLCNTGPFMTKINTNAAGDPSLIYSTCFGTTAFGYSSGIAVDGAGNAYIAAQTASTTFPQVGAIQGYGGGTDALVVKLNAAGNSILFSSFLGGSANDYANGIALDANNVYVIGSTRSDNFPTANAYQDMRRGDVEAFVSKIDMSGPVITPTNTSTPSRTATSSPTATRTATTQASATPTRTATRTATTQASATSTNTSTRTATTEVSATSTATRTATRTATTQASATATDTRRATYTPPPTFTPPPTNTATATNTPGGPTPVPCSINFIDVNSSDYFYQAVQYLYCRGAISGYGDNTFRPFNNTTRGQLVKIVVLAMNWPLETPAQPTFNDVPAGSTFYSFVETAVEHQMISGYSDGTFRPGANVTRGQLCKIITIAQRWPQIDPVDPHFSDVPVDHPFYVFIETAFSHGVISGYADGTFRPFNNATRGQLSKIVHQSVTQP